MSARKKGAKPSPTTNGRNGNGRDASTGRFMKGNPGGPGNLQISKQHKFREEFRNCISIEDFKAVAERLVEKAKAGEPWAVKELLDRTCGKPKLTVDMDTPVPFALYLNIDDSQI